MSGSADARDPAARRAAPASRVLERGADGWPGGLEDLSDPPPRLWIAGALPQPPWVAIVGSRAATPYGLVLAHRIAADLAHLGIPVVSGLARGIDAAAHRGAMQGGGRTIAVMPSGLDCVTPPSHGPLARSIAVTGAVMTETESGGPRYRAEFLHRNRLIAASAAVTVVVEAAESSGALSTAAMAQKLGRPVLAVPGDVDRATSRGTHALLRRGARVCEGTADVLAALERPGESREAERAKAKRAPRTAPAGADRTNGRRPVLDALTDEARVAAALAVRATTLDAIAAVSGLDVARTLAALMQLEWAGVACAHPGARWSRR